MDYRKILEAVEAQCRGDVDWTYSVSARGTLYITLRRGGFRYTFCFAIQSPRALDGTLCPDEICWMDVTVAGWQHALNGFLHNRIVDFRRFCLRVTMDRISRGAVAV